jgi:hypothetical protein
VRASVLTVVISSSPRRRFKEINGGEVAACRFFPFSSPPPRRYGEVAAKWRGRSISPPKISHTGGWGGGALLRQPTRVREDRNQVPDRLGQPESPRFCAASETPLRHGTATDRQHSRKCLMRCSSLQQGKGALTPCNGDTL